VEVIISRGFVRFAVNPFNAYQVVFQVVNDVPHLTPFAWLPVHFLG